MFDKKKKRSSSLVRDELRDTDWPDSVSVTGDEPPLSNGGGLLGGKHDTGAGYPGHGRKYSAGQAGTSGGTNGRQVSDRKTDMEKLYWNGSLAGAGAEEEAAAGLGPGNKRPDINGFNHSATAAFDVIDKTFWNEKNQSFEDQKATEAHVDKVFEQKRKAAAAAAAATHGGQAAMKSYQQQQVNSFQNQFVSGEVEKFHWNDKIPGEEETVKSNQQTSSANKMISSGTANQHQPSTRKSKLNGMREFQNFNDEEKLYWNEKLHQFSAVKQQARSGLNGSSTDMTRSGKETNGYPTSYQNFLDEKLRWNDKISDMFALAVPTVSGNGNVKHQQQQGMYRSYLQSYEAAAASRLEM